MRCFFVLDIIFFHTVLQKPEQFHKLLPVCSILIYGRIILHTFETDQTSRICHFLDDSPHLCKGQATGNQIAGGPKL